MKTKNIILIFTTFLILERVRADDASIAPKSYDEFKDKNIEFSLDDGENESKFHFEDQSLINKRMKELEAKKALRLKKMNSEILAEELSEAQANKLTLKEKNYKLYDLRQKRLKVVKEHKEKVQGIFSLNNFHHYKMDNGYGTKNFAAKVYNDHNSRSIASIPHVASSREPAFIGRMPAEKDIQAKQALNSDDKNHIQNSQKFNIDSANGRKPQSTSKGFMESAKTKVLIIIDRLKAWFK